MNGPSGQSRPTGRVGDQTWAGRCNAGAIERASRAHSPRPQKMSQIERVHGPVMSNVS